MDAFNFVASVFGLLLGFTLVELLAAFVRVMKSRGQAPLPGLHTFEE